MLLYSIGCEDVGAKLAQLRPTLLLFLRQLRCLVLSDPEAGTVCDVHNRVQDKQRFVSASSYVHITSVCRCYRHTSCAFGEGLLCSIIQNVFKAYCRWCMSQLQPTPAFVANTNVCCLPSDAGHRAR